ncbi:uncharacterized protein LOC124669861 [Lolium rigidum]|uniref:uncharacterized protein LOC124669861 n=1 Tax=Lolium rigidum TaxID=89674 RepID=UPI001F5D5813|nr:uncharacterized protein LOC124669861 [Lolium rigidum]
MASSSVLPIGGGVGAAVLTRGTAAGKALAPRPCFLAARPHAVSGGRLRVQTPPRSSPAYKNAANATDDAIQNVKEVAGKAADKASDAKDSAAETAGKGGASKVAETARDLGGKAKQTSEEVWDATKDAAQGVADKVAAAAKDLS